MADMGRALISKIIDENDIVTALAAGVQAEWFEDAEHRAAFTWMLDFFSKHSQCPSEHALKQQFPNYRLTSVIDPYEYYVEHFRDLRTRAILVDAVIDAHTALEDDDPVKAQHRISSGLLQLGSEVSSLTDENAVGNLKARYQEYRVAAKNRGKLTGVSTGFPTLDMCTGGYHDGQFVVLGGSAKQGKSWMLMAMAIAAQEQGKKVLFISFEMSVKEQLARYDGMTCGLNSMKLLHGNLDDGDFTTLNQGMRVRKNMAPFVISADITATTTVSGLSGKIEQHQPDLVIVDGAYLMQSEGGEPPGSTQALTAVSRGLKRTAQRIKRPLLATTQALPSKMKHGEVTMGSLGWTSAWSQDADLILGVERIPDSNILKLRVVAGRNVSPREIGLTIDWEASTLEETGLL